MLAEAGAKVSGVTSAAPCLARGGEHVHRRVHGRDELLEAR
jgi:hypothetical protein